MAQEGKACCPPGSEPYLQSEYAATGSIESVPYGDGATLEMYCPPRQKEGLTSAVIVAPDVWGWNGGRTRAIADSIAAKGHIVVVPKLLATPAMDGGTDGDALGPDSKFSMDWIKNFPYPDVQKPKVDACLKYLTELGAKKIGVIGFCYGGHVCAWSSKENPGLVAACAVMHPSIQLETFAFGGDFLQLTQEVQAPFLICPAGNDLENFGPESEFAKRLQASAKGADSVITPYPEMTHGFASRGDLSKPEVARDAGLALGSAVEFFAKHLA